MHSEKSCVKISQNHTSNLDEVFFNGGALTPSLRGRRDTGTLYQILVCGSKSTADVFGIFLFKNFCVKLWMKVESSYMFQRMRKFLRSFVLSLQKCLVSA